MLGWGLVVATGCGTYHLEGVVIPGSRSGLMAVADDDPRLTRPGIPSVMVTGVVEPRSLHPEELEPTRTDERGAFSIPVRMQGAGFLEYEAELLFRRAGQTPIRQRVVLPGSGKVLLVVMTTGMDDGAGTIESDPIRETLKAGEAFDR
jgi:hypothetical protein